MSASTVESQAATAALRLLGIAAWRDSCGTWHALTRKDAALLARLALSGLQARGPVAAWLWPDVPAPRANANLRQRLFRLRRQCGELIEESAAGLRLSPSVECDLRHEGCSADADLSAPLLDGLAEGSQAEDDEVQQWLHEARQHWSVRRLDLLAQRAEEAEAAGRLPAALAATEQLLVDQPLHEHAWRRLMRLHSRRGDRAAALAAFERCEAVLRDELGIKPSPETLALLHEVETLSPPVAAQRRDGSAVALPASLLHPPRLVGRAAQTRAMVAAWQSGAAFVLVGMAGQGKSRLLGELAAQGPGRVLESARPGDENLSYGALARLLRSMHRAAPRPGALWPTGAVAHELARLLPELGPAPTAPGLEALLHGAIEQVFDNAPRAGLQAVLFDDLQHADEATRAVLRRVTATPGLRWGLACRPESGVDLASWLASSARLQAVHLPGLTDADLDELLQTLHLPGLNVHTLLPALSRRCAGNPLFVLETLKHLVLHGAQPPVQHGATGIVDDAAQLPLPASVEVLLSQRLARLTPAAQNLARVAAVAGADFHPEVAADVLDTGLVTLSEPWSELQQAQVLRADASGMVDAFAHESLRDAVLRSVPQALRAPLHARLARSLRERGAPPQRVALHFAAAGDLLAAAPLAQAAAAQALRLGRSAEWLQQLRQAAAWYASAGDLEAAFAAELEAAEACAGSEGPEAAQQRLDELLARSCSPRQRVAVLLAQATLWVSGYDADRALAAATAARAEAPAGGVDELRARVLHAAALARSHDAATALQATRALLPRLQQLDDEAMAASLWAQCAVVFNSNGDADGCAMALQQQRELARRVGHSELEAAALASLSGQLHMLGQLDEAIATGEQAVDLHRRIGAQHTALLCEINLAMSLIARSELHRAQQLLGDVERGLQGHAEGGDVRRVVAEMQATAHLRLGQAAAALQVLQQSWPADDDAQLALPRQLNRLALRGLAWQQLGDATAAQACWQALGDKVPAGSSTPLHLRSRVLASQALPDEAAQHELHALLQASHATRFVAGEALARMHRAERALSSGRPCDALADADALLRARRSARHVFVSETELLALVARVHLACGQPDRAVALQHSWWPWLRDDVLPHLPPGAEAHWRAMGAHLGLLPP